MDDEVRWGIIGSGDVAEHKGGPALYNVEGSRLVAVMSRRAEKAADFARRTGPSATTKAWKACSPTRR